MLRFALIVLALAAVSCARYELVPLTAAECPPEIVVPLDSNVVTAGPPDSLVGRLWFAPEHKPVPDARVELLADRRRAGLDTTDAGGEFGFARVEGLLVLRIRAIGFKPRDDTLRLVQPGVARVVVEMQVLPFDGCPGFQAKFVRKPWWRFW